MSIITNSSLLLATEALRHRLVKPANIGANILDPIRAFETNLEDYYGRFIGCFIRRSNTEPCFLLFARSDPIDNIDYLFAFYLGHNFSRIQPSELQLLKGKIPRLFKSKIATSVINIHSEVPSTCHLSVLLQAVEFSINPSLMSDFVPRQDLKVGKVSSLVCFNANIPFPNCNLSTFQPDTRRICKFIKDLNLKVIRYKGEAIPSDFHILVAPYRNHLVYIIHYLQMKSMMILLPHVSQFRSHKDVDKFLDDLKTKLLPYKPKYFGATRYYGEINTVCNSKEILKACVFCFLFGNNLINVVKQSDVEAVLSDDRLEQAMENAARIIQESMLQSNSEDSIPIANIPEPCSSPVQDDTRVTDIRCDGIDGEAEVLSVQQEAGSSQETIIMTDKDLLNEFRRLFDYETLLSYKTPPVPTLEARTDMRGDVLESRKFYFDALELVTELWHKLSSVFLVPSVSLDFIRQSGFTFETLEMYRYIILPIHDDDWDLIIIIDRERDEWVSISPDNEAVKDHEVFGEIDSVAGKICKPLKDIIGWPIMITSSFHRQYPRVHLIVSLFYLAKLFKYCPSLPKKIIYTERDFRWYCYDVCFKLQLTNLEHNIMNDLIKDNGGLKQEAFRSILAPIDFERSVVPSDQCPYCLKRGFSILANHITMKHRGDSDMLHKIRNSRE